MVHAMLSVGVLAGLKTQAAQSNMLVFGQLMGV